MRGTGDQLVARADLVISAATEVFLRYGYARTTMGDIAGAAKLSRPLLYLVFPGKEEVFAAVVKRMNADALAEMRGALPQLPSLEDRLRHVCLKWGAHGFDITAAHPDARDLFDLSRASVREIHAEFQAFVVELIGDAVSAARLPVSAEALARTLVYSMRGLKETAVDAADMRRLIDVQVSLLVSLLGTVRKPRQAKARSAR